MEDKESDVVVESIVLPPSYKKQLKSRKQSEKELHEEQRLRTLNVAACFASFI